MTMKRKFAVFDIDGTLARTSLFFQIAHALIDHELLPNKKVPLLNAKVANYNNRKHKDAFREYNDILVSIFEDNITKVHESDYRKVVDKVVGPKKQETYVYTRNLIQELRDQEYFLIALSGSEMYSVKQFTSLYDFDIAVGTQYLTENGQFTGEVKKVVNRKDRFIKRFVEEHNLTYQDSVSIGDSMGDASVLKLVETAIAFNPEDKLYTLAKEQAWKIVIERKNVIYELEPSNGTYLLA